MMKWRDVKSIWKDNGEVPALTKSDLLEILQKRSVAPIARIKQNVTRELFGAVIVFPLCAVFFYFWKDGNYREIAYLFFCFCVLFCMYYFLKMHLLNQMQTFSSDMKNSLEKQLATLKRYLEVYLWTASLITPALIIFLGWLTFYKKQMLHLPSKFGTFSSIALPYISIAVAIGVVLYFIYRRYLGRAYGNHLKYLKRILKEMEEV